MTPAVLERPGSVTERPVLGRGGTLEELLSAALHEARANGSAECPVCHASMTFSRAGATCGSGPACGGADATPVAECGGCGTRLG